MCFLLIGQLAYSHVTRIRVKQNQDGSLTWRVETYHSNGQCGVANSGITINGVNYPLQSEGSMNESDRYTLPNDGFSLFANATSNALFGYQVALRSYGQVTTPYIPGTLNVQPYSSNACWAFSVGGNGSFTPPPPPVCTTPPVTSMSNTLGTPTNNNTDCDPTDDSIPVTLNINHLACGNITGDGQLSIYYSDGSLIANVAYQNGIATPYTFNLPQGKLAQVRIIDNDFPNNPFNYTITGLNGTSYAGEVDATPPTFNSTPVDVTVECDTVPTAVTISATDNCDANIFVNFTELRTDGTSINDYILTRTWTATDQSGNSSSQTQVVTVQDTISPILVGIPTDATVECDAVLNVAAVSATDNCSANLAVDYTEQRTDGTSIGNYTLTRTWSVTDESGNAVSQTQIINVQDTVIPNVLTQNITVELDANGVANFTAEMIDNGTTDNCGGVTISLTENSLQCGDVGENVIGFIATDVNGNTNTVNVIVTVVDNENPTIMASANILSNNDTDLCAAEIVVPAPTFDDNCANGGSTTFAFDGNDDYAQGPEGVVPVTGEFTVSVWAKQDSHNPNELREIFAQGRNLYLGYAPGGTIRVGDSWGNTGVLYPTDSQWHHFSVVRSTDNTYLYIDGVLAATKGSAIPSPNQNAFGQVWDYTFRIGSQWGGGEFFNGNIDEIQVWNYAQSQSSIACNMNQRLLGTETGLVAYYDFEDNLGSSIISDKVNGNNANISNADVNSAWIGSEQPASKVNIVNDFTNTCDASAIYPVGTTIVTWTATDPSGNTATSSQEITVVDSQLPGSITVSGDSTINIPSGNTIGWSPWVHNFNIPIPNGTKVSRVKMDFRAVDQGWGGTGGFANFKIAGQTIGNAQLFHDERSFSIDYVGNIPNYNISGNNQLEMYFLGYPGWVGNFKGGTMTIYYDNGSSANNITIQLDVNGSASINVSDIDPGITDNCGIESKTLDISNFDCSNIGENNINLTVEDVNGNTNVFPAIVTVEDNVNPIVNTQNVTVQLDASGNGITTAELVNNGSTDACGIQSLALDTTSFTCANVGENTVTLTITDNNGNISTQTAIVTVEDNVNPIVVTQDIPVELDANGNATITTSMIDNGSTDACGIASYSLDIETFDCSNTGANTVTLTVTDNNGNSASSIATVTVSDIIAPTVITQNYAIDLANGVANITANDIDGGTFDNCAFTLSIDRADFSCDDIGDHTITLTATDASGNTHSDTATVSILGDVPSISINDFNAVNTQKVNTIFLGFADTVNLTTIATGGSSFTYEWTTSSGELVSNEANPSISPEVSTTYNVTVTNSNGCTASTSLYVCVIDARAFDKKGRYKGKVVVCHHTNGKKGTKHVQIEISSSAVASHLQHGLGTDHADTLGACNAVCVDNTNAKGSSKKIAAATTTSIEDNLLIYPNPSNGIFDIRLTAVDLQTDVFLFDTTGKLIERKSIPKENSSENIITIGNNNLANGFYILKIITKNETITKKLIIEKSN